MIPRTAIVVPSSNAAGPDATTAAAMAAVASGLDRTGLAPIWTTTVPPRIQDIARAIRRGWLDGAGLVVTVGGLEPGGRTTPAVALAWDLLLEDEDGDGGNRPGLPVGAEPLGSGHTAAADAGAGFWLLAEPRATLALPANAEAVAAALAADPVASYLEHHGAG